MFAGKIAECKAGPEGGTAATIASAHHGRHTVACSIQSWDNLSPDIFYLGISICTQATTAASRPGPEFSSVVRWRQRSEAGVGELTSIVTSHITRCPLVK